MPSLSGNVWALIIQIFMFYHNYWGVQLYTLLGTLNLANLVTTSAFLCDFIIYGREKNVKLCVLRATSGCGVTHIFAYTSPNLCISSQYRTPITVFMEHLQFEFQKELLWTDLGKYCGSLLWFIRFG